MSDVTIKFHEGCVSGGYAFSANSKEILMSSYVEGLPEAEKELLIYEATKAREAYIASVTEKKARGEKVSALTIKREAVAEAKKLTIAQYGEEEYNRIKLECEKLSGGVVSVSGKPKKEIAKKSKATKEKKPKKEIVNPKDEDFGDDFSADDLNLDSDEPDAFDAEIDVDSESDINVDETDPFDDL